MMLGLTVGMTVNVLQEAIALPDEQWVLDWNTRRTI